MAVRPIGIMGYASLGGCQKSGLNCEKTGCGETKGLARNFMGVLRLKLRNSTLPNALVPHFKRGLQKSEHPAPSCASSASCSFSCWQHALLHSTSSELLVTDANAGCTERNSMQNASMPAMNFIGSKLHYLGCFRKYRFESYDPAAVQSISTIPIR